MDIPGYKIIQPIDNGGVGELYLATQLKLGLPVVIKYIPKALLDQTSVSKLLSRFIKEGEIARQFSHPNLAQVHEVGQNSEALYSIADYVPGNSLEKRASEMCLLDKIYVIKQLAGALDYIARFKIGHYNIKPSNIILSSETSRSMLTDFGFLRDMYCETELLLQSKLLDSADYASPERQQQEPLDARSDLYSLGAVFCFLLTGKAPFKSGSEVVGSEPVTESFVELPTELSIFQQFVDFSLARMPEERFQTGREMIEELSKIDDEQIIEIEGHEVERKQSRQEEKSEAFKGNGNVVPLMSAAKKKQLEFEKLLAPKPEPVQEKPVKDKEPDKSAWADIPETEFVNSYEFINSFETYRSNEGERTSEDRKITEVAAKIAKPKELLKKKSSKKRVLKTSIKKHVLSDSENPRQISATSQTAKNSEKLKREPISRAKPALVLSQAAKVTPKSSKQHQGKEQIQKPTAQAQTPRTTANKQKSGIGATSLPTQSDAIEIPQEIFQALVDEPWPPYRPAPGETKNYVRRTALLCLLLISSVAFYVTYQQSDSLDKFGISTPITGQLEQRYERSMDRAVNNLTIIQKRARDGLSNIFGDAPGSSENISARESSLNSASDQTNTTRAVIEERPAETILESTTTIEEKTVDPSRKTQKQERMDWLLAKAERLKGEGKLLSPADNNALLIYREMLTINPNNVDASTGIKMLRQEVIEQINVMIELGRLDSADALLTRMNIFFKPAPPIGDLATRIRALRQSKSNKR